MRSAKPRTSFVAVLAALSLMACGVSYSLATTYTVSTVSALESRVGSVVSGDIINITPGTYNMTRGLQMNTVGVTIQGSTGNRDDVILRGAGMNVYSGSSLDEGILLNVDNITVKNLTLKDYYYNALHIRAESDVDNVFIDNVKTWNVGERHVKVSAGGGNYSDNVTITNLYMFQDQALTAPHGNLNYIGGIDAMTLNNASITDVLAQGIHGSNPADPQQGNAAVFLWNDCRNSLVERVRVYDCDKGIALGNPSGSGWQTTNITVRNNMIRRNTITSGNSIGLELVNSKDAKVYNNTFYSDNAGYGRLLSVQDNATYPTTNLLVKNNIFRGASLDLSTGNWTSADVAAMGNIVDTTGATVLPGWFTNTATADYHINITATAALNAGVTLADVLRDYDEVLRLGVYDLGADELNPHAGDANQDGHVNVDDLGIMASNYDASGKYWESADFTQDHTVNVDDLGVLATNYDWASGGSAVPEPATLGLLLAGALGLLRRRR